MRRRNLRTIHWEDSKGQQYSVQVQPIGAGAFSRVYLDPQTLFVYAVTRKEDQSKIILETMHAEYPNNRHLPAIQYLGTYRQAYDQSFTVPSDPSSSRSMIWEAGEYYVTAMPIYYEITKKDPLYATLYFLRRASHRWFNEEYLRVCQAAEFQPHTLSTIFENLGSHVEAYRKADLKKSLMKVSRIRKSLISYLEAYAGNEPQVHSIIDTLKLIDRYLDRYAYLPYDFDTVVAGFKTDNFMKDKYDNIVMTDPIFVNHLRSCIGYTATYTFSKDPFDDEAPTLPVNIIEGAFFDDDYYD